MTYTVIVHILISENTIFPRYLCYVVRIYMCISKKHCRLRQEPGHRWRRAALSDLAMWWQIYRGRTIKRDHKNITTLQRAPLVLCHPPPSFAAAREITHFVFKRIAFYRTEMCERNVDNSLFLLLQLSLYK